LPESTFVEHRAPEISDHMYAALPSKCDCEGPSHCIPCHKKQATVADREKSLLTWHRKLDTKRTSCKSLLVNDRNVKFYTGLLSKAVFDLLYKYVHDKVQEMHYWRGSTTTKILPDGTPVKKMGRVRKLDQRDELLLTLTKLKIRATK